MWKEEELQKVAEIPDEEFFLPALQFKPTTKAIVLCLFLSISILPLWGQSPTQDSSQ